MPQHLSYRISGSNPSSMQPTEKKKIEIEYWNKNLWKWRCYVWILRKIRKFRKKPNEADDRVCKELEGLCKIFGSSVKVVDLCSGDGSSLTKRLLENKRLKIVGVDLSRECAKSSPPFRTRGFECIVADCECIPIPSESIDVAVIRNSLHHLTDLHAFVREVYRILHAESVFLIIEVETKSRISDFIYHRILAEPDYPFITREEIVHILLEEGFMVNEEASLKVDQRRSFFIYAKKTGVQKQVNS